MEISIIIPTYNRGDQILNLLRSLEYQRFKDFEVIVVNDGSTDNTLAIIKKYKASTPLRLSIIDSENRGRAGSRNLGVKHAQGDVLLFLDDDVRANENGVMFHKQFHNRFSDAILGGPYRYDSNKFVNDFSFFRKDMEDKWYPMDKEPKKSGSLRINGGNFSVRRKDFWSVGGFDERLTDKEDFILAYSLHIKLKIEVYFFNDVWVFHDDFRGLKDYIQRARESKKAELGLQSLYDGVKELDPKRFITSAKFPKSLVFRLFNSTRLINCVDSNPKFLLLPKAIRYKLYDVILTANIVYDKYSK